LENGIPIKLFSTNAAFRSIREDTHTLFYFLRNPLLAGTARRRPLFLLFLLLQVRLELPAFIAYQVDCSR
jgi:hypothetical protein